MNSPPAASKLPGEGLVVARLHYTYTFKDPRVYREDYRYVYQTEVPRLFLPLLWRKRATQANMVTFDAARDNIVYLPSGKSRELTQSELERRWNAFIESIPSEDAAPIRDSLTAISPIVGVNATGQSFNLAKQVLGELEGRFKGRPEFDSFLEFAVQLLESYLPYVVSPPFHESGYLFVHHGVDVLETRRSVPAGEGWDALSLPEALRFFSTGAIRFDIPLPLVSFVSPPWERTESLHVRAILPDGFVVMRGPVGIPAPAFNSTDILDRSTKDAGLVYTYVTPFEGSRVFEQCGQLSRDYDETRSQILDQAKKLMIAIFTEKHKIRRMASLIGLLPNLNRKYKLALEAKRPRLRIGARVAVGIRPLLVLLWIVVATGYYASLKSSIDPNLLVTLLSALLVVILSLVVFAVEKPYLRWLIYAQIAASTACLLQLPILQFLVTRLGVGPF